MSVVVSSSLVLDGVASGGDIIDGNNPLIGYQNITTPANLSTTTENLSNPADNLTNPNTYSFWQGTALNANEYITVVDGSGNDIDYVGIAKHNFNTAQIAVSVEENVGVDSFTKLLLHFEGADASTTFTDSSPVPKTMTPVGNAQIDTADKKFNSASGLFDGSGDYLTTPDSVDWTFGTGDFTIEGFFKVNTASPGLALAIVGKTDSLLTAAGTSFVLRRLPANNWEFRVSDGSSIFVVSGTSQYTSAINPGWHHVAAVRTGNILRLFLDGVQEGGDVVFTGSVNDTATVLYVGGRDSVNQDAWFGWLDEVRISKGIARWTTNFTVPQVEAPWVEIVPQTIPPDDGPLLMRFVPHSVSTIRVRLQVLGIAPTAAVCYVGKLLILQRRIYVGHAPMKYSRVRQISNGRSETGAFLGRILKNTMTKTTVPMDNITPDFFRNEIDPFLQAAGEIPFFWAWRPQKYPYEVAYAWLTSDPTPLNSRSNGMMKISLDMAGIGI